MPKRSPLEEEPETATKGPNEEDELDEEEEDDDEPQEVAAAPVEPPPPPPKKNNRPKKPRRIAGLAGSTGDVAGMGAPPDGSEAWPQDAPEVWEKIVEQAAKGGRTPWDMYITVERFGIGGYAAEPVQLAQIEGGSVAGSEGVSAAQMLMDYMIDVCHARAAGPARYRLNFNWKRGGRIKVAELRMAHPQEIMMQRSAAAQRAMPPPPGPGFGARLQGYPQQSQQPMYPQPMMQQNPAYYPPPYPQYVPMPSQADPELRGSVEQMRRETAMMLGRLDEAARREAEARGQPAPPPMAPVSSPEGDDARTARVVVGVLQAMGIRPSGPAAAATAGPTGFGAAISDAKEKISGLRELVGIFREVEKLKEGFGLAAEEPTEIPAPIIEDPNKPAFGVKPIPFAKFQGKEVLWAERKEDEALLTEWLPRMAMANPEMSMQVLERALRVLDQGAFGVLLRKFAEQGGPAATAASVMADRVANGAQVGVSGNGGAYPPTSGGGYPTP